MKYRTRAARLVTAIALGAGALVGMSAAPASALAHAAVQDLPGCRDNALPDFPDASAPAPLGFDANFFGNTYDSVFVNENGNVTFGAPFDYYGGFDDPLGFNGFEIIAPLYANASQQHPESEITFGQTTWAGQSAFCVLWIDVTPDFFDVFTGPTAVGGEPSNTFQLLLVDRSTPAPGDVDALPGDFDIIFNYDSIEWDGSFGGFGEGDLGAELFQPLNVFGDGEIGGRAGYSNGNPFTPVTNFELPGSGELHGLTNDNVATGAVNNSLNSLTLGRYIFELEDGSAPAGQSISGTLSASGGGPLPDSPVSVCLPAGQPCATTVTNGLGTYNVGGLPDGDYSVTAFPPPLSSLQPKVVSPVTVAGFDVTVDFELVGPTPPPPGTTIEPSNGGGNVPVIHWQNVVTVTTTGCPGGVATLSVIHNGSTVATSPMTEAPAGTYTGSFGPLFPVHDEATVLVTIDCPEPTPDEQVSFDIYIDPSGVIVDIVTGDPVDGATATLYRSDSAVGPYTVVPDGSAIMSPTNRVNPDTTGPDGLFGWDVIAGYYFVRAEAPGCVDPDDSLLGFVDTDILPVEPEWLGLVMELDCAPVLSVPAPITVVAPDASGAVVTFAATAEDSDEGSVPVTCLPASGDLFPVGLTTVECVATDSFGNSAAGSFDVTVEAPLVVESIRGTIGDVRDALAGLLPTDKKVDKAIDRLDRALQDKYWANNDELTDDGKKALDDLRKAVHELEKVKGEHAGAAAAQAEILADQAALLAQNAIDDAIAGGGDAKDIAKAEKEMAKAADDRADGDLSKAVSHYRKAWDKAHKALD